MNGDTMTAVSSFRRRAWRRAASAVLVIAAAGFGLTAFSGAAQAASPCAGNGPVAYGYQSLYCQNSPGAPVFYGPSYNSPQVGTMNTTNSYFFCRTDQGDPNGESAPHPYRWEFTQADNGAWGFMPDRYISSETDPLEVC